MTQKITLDIIPSGDFIREVVRLKQGDNLTRTIAVKLTNGGSPFTVPAGSTVRLRGKKVDGTGFMIPSSGYSQADGYTFVLSNDNLGVAGLIYCDVAYFSSDGAVGSTEPFMIENIKTALDPETYIGTNDYADLLQAIIYAESLRGIESVAKTSTSGVVDTYTITFTDGTTTNFTVTNASDDAVKYTAQTLTEAQKAQARDNIGIGTDSGASQQILDFALGMAVVDFGAADNIVVLLKDDDFIATQSNFRFGADFGQNYAGIKTVTFIPITENLLLYGLYFPTTFLGAGSGITMKSAGAQPLSAYNVGEHHRTIMFTFDGMGNCYPDIIDRQM